MKIYYINADYRTAHIIYKANSKSFTIYNVEVGRGDSSIKLTKLLIHIYIISAVSCSRNTNIKKRSIRSDKMETERCEMGT